MLSIPHLIIIFIVALVVFGPEKIPELARNLGKIMAEFRRVTGDLRITFEGHLRDLEREADQRRIASLRRRARRRCSRSCCAPRLRLLSEPTHFARAPGTVPSNPPNAAAIAPNRRPPIRSRRQMCRSRAPGDPMHDPYLRDMDLPAANLR